MTYNYHPTDLQIYKAALRDDWNSVSQIFEEHPELTTKPISQRLETPLMIAVGTNCSHHFVEKLVEMLIHHVGRDALLAKNYEGNNALHYAAKVGNMTDAKYIRSRFSEMISIPNSHGNTPLILAAELGKKDMLEYMIRMTPFFSIKRDGLYDLVGGGNIIALIIQAGFVDLALMVTRTRRDIVLETDLKSQRTALEVLATKRELFLSGSRLGFWGHLVYSLMPTINVNVWGEDFLEIHAAARVKMFSTIFIKVCDCLQQITTGFFNVLRHSVAAIFNNIHAIKLHHEWSIELVNNICKIITEKGDHDMAWKILGSAIAIAVRYGTYELIEECILAYPSIIWYDFEGSYLFHLAIKERQEQVYNLLYQMTSHKAFVASHVHAEEQENALHMAAKLAPPHRLNRITGAALQMQHELQWFKEVETLVEPSYKEALNKNGKTPRMVFTDEHNGLLKEGQQWMKDTSSSCTVVAALIVTVTFAAGFTLPGGNNDDDGRPVLLNKGAFMLFIISNVIALFSSSTSLLMFLGILTSRYAEDDFLYVLPKRMTIGLVALFLSLATTLITFSAALTLVLQDKVTWIAAPLVIITSIPVCLFGSLQFPVLMELVNSTYGPSIFHKQNDRMIH